MTTTLFINLYWILFVEKHGTPILEELGAEIAEKWIKLGRRLGVHDAELQEINKGHDQLSEKGYHMLKNWGQKKGSAATYQALCEGLEHKLVQRQDLAEKFCYSNGNYFLQFIYIKCGYTGLMVFNVLEFRSS